MSPPRRGVTFRRSRHLVCYWFDGELRIHNYATGAQLATHPLTLEILDLFNEWKPASVLTDSYPELQGAPARQLVRLLVRSSLLSRSDRPSQREQAMQAFARWNPVAGLFHGATKDVAYADPDTGEGVLRRQSKTWPLPAVTKRYPDAPRVPLPPPQAGGEFANVVLNRRTWRQFSDAPVQLGELATLLGLVGRVQHWVRIRGQGELPLKTHPSGGARHPLELYVLALRIDGLRRGLYHYAADSHELELVSGNVRRGTVARYLPRQYWFEPAAAVVLFTGVFTRTLWRYDYARAYRAVLIEAGHACQTFCLAATSLDLAPFCTMGLADSAIERDLRIDGVSESVLYAAGVGRRPAGMTNARMPADRRSLRVRPNHPPVAPVAPVAR